MEPFFVNCYECYVNEPVEAEIEIRLENGLQYFPAVVDIYEGTLEENLLLETQTTTSESTIAVVPFNKMYTITARYHINGTYYTAVNSLTPRIKYDKEQCDEPCYYVYDKVVDLRLKYTK
jgi:hypothetical protein